MIYPVLWWVVHCASWTDVTEMCGGTWVVADGVSWVDATEICGDPWLLATVEPGLCWGTWVVATEIWCSICGGALVSTWECAVVSPVQTHRGTNLSELSEHKCGKSDFPHFCQSCQNTNVESRTFHIFCSDRSDNIFVLTYDTSPSVLS